MPDENNNIVSFKTKYTEHQSKNKSSPQSLITNDRIELLIGLNLIPLINPEFLSSLDNLRRNFAGEYGIIIPSIRIRDWTSLEPSEYMINIQSAPVIQYRFIGGRIPFINKGERDPEEIIDCELSHDPLLGFKILWIKPEDKETALKLGCKSMEYQSIILSHLNVSINKNLSSLISYDDVHDLIHIIKNEIPALMNEIKIAQISISVITRIIKDLLSDGIPINNLSEILESIIDAHLDNKDISYVSNAVLAKLVDRKKTIDI